MTSPRRPFPHRPERRLRLVLAAIEAIGAPRFCPCVGSRTAIGLATAPCGAETGGWPNVCLSIPIAAVSPIYSLRPRFFGWRTDQREVTHWNCWTGIGESAPFAKIVTKNYVIFT
jgi:hypothetical protein